MTQPTMDRLHEASVWARTFTDESKRELIGARNDHRQAARQLMVSLNQYLNPSDPRAIPEAQ